MDSPQVPRVPVDEEWRLQMEGTFTYQCQDCEALLSSAPNGSCPRCGSQAVLSLDWYGLTPVERGSWFDRIHGRPRIAPLEQLVQSAD